MRASFLLRVGLALILIGIIIRFEAAPWSSSLLDPSMTSSKEPVYIADKDKKEAFVFTSEILSVLGVILTSIGAYRSVKAP